MSYSGSHTQFGHSDLQLLQNHVMVAQLQELQKQQQHGQLSDVKSQSPMTTYLSRFGKQTSVGQIPNLSGGMAVNTSDIFAPHNMNWMHLNLPSPTQGFSSNSNLHDQGLMTNPSLYGTPVAPGRANIGHYPPLHGVPLQNSPRSNSLQKNMSLLDYSRVHGQEKSEHLSDSGGTAGLDPLEEKILFDRENSGWDRSLSKLATLDVEEYANSSETTNPFSSVQSGSWSALMQSAVAEISSNDTGVHEQLSGLCYQNMEPSTDNQPGFQQTGLQSSFEQGSKKYSSDINIEHWSRLSQSLQNRQQSDQLVPSKHLRNDWNNQGENSSDCYNSKVSHAYTSQPCLNAADSESSARSSQKSQNQALCMTSPGADTQQECFSLIKSDNVLHTKSVSAIKVKHNQSEDALSKCSPASNICATIDSKNTPERDKGCLVSGHGGTAKFGSAVSQTERGPTQDVFSFQSSVLGDSAPVNLENKQKRQTWWMPSSLGQSVPSLQRALAQNWSTKSSNLGNSGFEISNLKSETLSHGPISPGPLSLPSESISKRAETGQQVSLFGSSRDSHLLENTGITGFQNYASGAFRNTLPYISHSNQLGMKPSQRDVMLDPCKVSYNLGNLSTPYFNGNDQSSLVDPSAHNSEITINGEDQLDKVTFNKQKSFQNQGSEICPQIFSSSGKAETFQLSGRHGDAVDGNMSCILDSQANQMGSKQQVLASSTLHGNADNMKLILRKSRKRKFSSYGGLPWHVEVMQCSWKLPDVSIAEQDWAKATNRLVERVNENDTLEDMGPVARGKKRLISTSQLMQQVFQPPPSSILRVDAASDYELLLYFVSKVALSDTCKLISTPRIHIPHEHGGIGAARLVNASSNGDNSLIKDAEVLVEKAMKLESQIKGLDGSLLTVDVRRECQELEKRSLINHFAKYHGQLTQSNATDTQSPFLRRYVSPTSVPQKLPERTKCLSL